MDQAPELEVVDLGEAKEVTKGCIFQPLFEDHPEYFTRPEW